jgi:hypothetical protein
MKRRLKDCREGGAILITAANLLGKAHNRLPLQPFGRGRGTIGAPRNLPEPFDDDAASSDLEGYLPSPPVNGDRGRNSGFRSRSSGSRRWSADYDPRSLGGLCRDDSNQYSAALGRKGPRLVCRPVRVIARIAGQIEHNCLFLDHRSIADLLNHFAHYGGRNSFSLSALRKRDLDEAAGDDN